jgi:hypothetical protein
MFDEIWQYKLTRNYTLDITPTVKELARCFAELGHDEQAEFFNEVGRIAREEWDSSHALNMQVFDIVDNGGLDDDGRRLLEVIAEFIMEDDGV